MTSYFHDVCLATAVTSKALRHLQEAGSEGARLRTSHPWYVALELFRELQDSEGGANTSLAIVLFDQDQARFSHWARLLDLEVVEFHRGSWESCAVLDTLHPIPTIFSDADSICHAPSHWQLARERSEPVQPSRTPVEARQLVTYAMCERPAFIPDKVD